MRKVILHLRESWYKYLLEMLGVVIGILIAFSLDNWNSVRKEREGEIKTLREIRSSLARDLLDVKFNMHIYESQIKSCEIILTAAERNLPYHDSLSRHFSRSHWITFFQDNSGPFETLKTRGFDVITNDNLRRRIVNLYSRAYTLIHQFEQVLERLSESFQDIDRANFDKTELWDAKNPTMEGKMIPLDFETLKKNRNYIYELKTLMSANKSVLDISYRHVKADLEKLIADLDAEIKKQE